MVFTTVFPGIVLRQNLPEICIPGVVPVWPSEGLTNSTWIQVGFATLVSATAPSYGSLVSRVTGYTKTP